MKQFGLLGYRLNHTMSPQIHFMLGEILGEELSYKVLDIDPEEFDDKLPSLFQLDGFNVTIPYKLKVMEHLDSLDVSAKNHGSVNVVSIGADGKKIGYNTDCIGFLRSMQAEEIPLKGKVCVVGGGGVGRMFVMESVLHGCSVTLAVRNKHLEESEAIAIEIQKAGGAPISVWDATDLVQYPGSFDLLINATPVGMFPNMEVSPVEPLFLSRVRAVFDCVYNPAETLLIRQARAAGCKVCGGMKMLVWQAAAAQEIWFNKRFKEEQIEHVIKKIK